MLKKGVNENEKNFFNDITDTNIVHGILSSLASRDFKNELPVSEQTFRFKRNVEECEKLKISVCRLLDQGRIDKKEDTVLLEDVSRLIALEKRKAHWLEKNYYPALYEKAINSAKGEVNQFLIKQKHTAQLDDFTDNKDISINLKDELTYLIDGNNPESAGVYKQNRIDIRIPDYYTKQDEWKIFLVSVHELVHHASFQESDRIGIKERSKDPDQEEINEAVTEITSFIIAKDHLEKQKTPLSGENTNLNLGDMRMVNTFIS